MLVLLRGVAVAVPLYVKSEYSLVTVELGVVLVSVNWGNQLTKVGEKDKDEKRRVHAHVSVELVL